jgi:hypothetical protein
VISFVSRLAPLARSSLEPAYYHCWMITQLAFVTNVVLVFPCAFYFLAHLQLHISDYGSIDVVAAVLIHFFPDA